jgi:hypothetical protein
MVCPIRHNKRGNPLAALALTLQPFEEVPMTRDPRSEAEKARADLARNAELGLAVPESPLEEGPSVTPETFGDTTENGQVPPMPGQTGEDVEASRDIGDSTGTMATSRDVPVSPKTVQTPPTHRSDESDGVLSRAKE